MKYSNPDVDSSYRPNNIGETLYEVVKMLQPKKIIEFGTLHGYSAIAMAMALDEIGSGVIETYDLWGSYKHRHARMSDTQANIENYGLSKYISCLYGDIDKWRPEHFDLMHVDVSNTGETIRSVYDRFKDFGGVIIFEGGSKERDDVEWMKRYKKKPINGCGVHYKVIDERFPSLSIICE